MDASDLEDDPIRQLRAWIDEARLAGEPMPEAMCVATASSAAEPSARLVLVRGLDDDGLVFYTNYDSDKARDLAENPRTTAVFHFLVPAHRQVRVRGAVMKTSADESDRYWETRPAESRRSAVASRQSRVVESREELERAVAELGDAAPGRPAHWGGYRVVPASVEFWQEGPNRLHDRLRYSREGTSWRVERLAP